MLTPQNYYPSKISFTKKVRDDMALWFGRFQGVHKSKKLINKLKKNDKTR